MREELVMRNVARLAELPVEEGLHTSSRQAGQGRSAQRGFEVKPDCGLIQRVSSWPPVGGHDVRQPVVEPRC